MRSRRRPVPQPWGERVAWARRHVALVASATSAAGVPGRRSSRRRPSGWSGRWTGWPASMRSRSAVELDVFTRTLGARARDRPRPGGAHGRRGPGRFGEHGGRPRSGPGRGARPGRRVCSRHRPGTTRSCPITSGRRPATNCPCGPRASSASTANFSPPWPVPVTRSVRPAWRPAPQHGAGARRAGSSRSPAPWRESGGGRASSRRADEEWLTHVASFDAGHPPHGSSPPRSRSTGCARSWCSGSTRLSVPVLAAAGDARLGAGAEVVAARRSDRFTRFDGNLAGLRLPSPADRATSATRLESWASCPFAYLMRNILGVEEVENPEDESADHPRDKGSLVHQVLEDFIDEVLGPPDRRSTRLRTKPWSASDRARMVAIAEAVCDRLRAAGPDRSARSSGTRTSSGSSRTCAVPRGRFDLPRRPRHAAVGRRAGFRVARLPTLGTVALELPDGRGVQLPGLRPTGSTWPTTARSMSSTTRQARPTITRSLSEDNPDDARDDAAARRLRPGGPPPPGTPPRRRCGPSTGSSRHGAASSGSGTPVTPEVLTQVGRDLGAMVTGSRPGSSRTHPTARARPRGWSAPTAIPTAWAWPSCAVGYEHKRADPAHGRLRHFAHPAEDTLDDRDGAAGR